jgi:hypothetical protein
MVRFRGKADMAIVLRMSAYDPKRTSAANDVTYGTYAKRHRRPPAKVCSAGEEANTTCVIKFTDTVAASGYLLVD